MRQVEKIQNTDLEKPILRMKKDYFVLLNLETDERIWKCRYCEKECERMEVKLNGLLHENDCHLSRFET